jgi:hypothetical protein
MCNVDVSSAVGSWSTSISSLEGVEAEDDIRDAAFGMVSVAFITVDWVEFTTLEVSESSGDGALVMSPALEAALHLH